MTQDSNIFELEKNYSTTRRVTKEKPVIENKPEDKVKTQLFLPAKQDRKGEGGLRTQGYFKHSESGKPLISVITVVFNGEKYLEQTIQSVINQTYSNVEYIIIDGGSTDGTLDIIKKYEGMVDYWVSEGDEGIYYAMNKGIILGTGKWINFMNCGDNFYKNTVLSNLFSGKQYNNIGFIYGNYELKYNDFSKIKRAVAAEHSNCFWKGMPSSHQSLFVKLKIHKLYSFDTSLSIAADFDLILNIIKYNSIKLDIIVSSMMCGGISDKKQIKSIMEWRKVALYKYFTKNKRIIATHYMFLIFITALQQIIEFCVPCYIINAVKKLKYNIANMLLFRYGT